MNASVFERVMPRVYQPTPTPIKASTMHTTQDHALSRADTDFSNRRRRRRVMPNKKRPTIHNPILKEHFAFLEKSKKREANHAAVMAKLDRESEKIRKEELKLKSEEADDVTDEELDAIVAKEAEDEIKLREEAEDNQHTKWAINKLTRKKHGEEELESLRAEIHKESKSIAIKFFTAKYKGEDKERKLAQFKKAIKRISLDNIKESTDSIRMAMDNLSSGIDPTHEYLKELTKYYKDGAVKYLTDKHDEEYAEDFMEKVKDMAHKRKMRNVDVRPESQPPQQVAAASRVVDLTASDDGN